MEVTTTRRFAPMPEQKEWAWSYSKLKNYEVCPRRMHHTDILKDVPDEESENLACGNRVHKAAAERLDLHRQLSKEMAFLAPWCTLVEGAVQRLKGKLLVEQQLAATRAMQPTGWFSKDVWFRGIADALVLAPPVAISFDWKTGKIVEDSVQLALVAALLFAHYPDINKIRSQFIWLKEGTETTVDMTRGDLPSLWAGVLPRVASLEQASKTGEFPPKPGRFCKRFCPVSSCQYHGVGTG
jgi:hypothetical protein